jgi:hypothetical protein
MGGPAKRVRLWRIVVERLCDFRRGLEKHRPMYWRDSQRKKIASCLFYCPF